MIERASTVWERRVFAPLGEVAGRAAAAGIASPALFLAGDVAKRSRARPAFLFAGASAAASWHTMRPASTLQWLLM